jgi:hypothetical protein
MHVVPVRVTSEAECAKVLLRTADHETRRDGMRTTEGRPKLTPLGSLSVLPPELRAKVYSQAVDDPPPDIQSKCLAAKGFSAISRTT